MNPVRADSILGYDFPDSLSGAALPKRFHLYTFYTDYGLKPG
jgi:hypothetical protein